MVGNLDLQRLCSSDNKLSGVFFMPGMCSDSHISHLTVARKYQIVQQCLYAAAAKPEEAEALVERLGAEFAAWFRYVLSRKK